MRTKISVLVAVLSLASLGCQRPLNEERSITIEAQGFHSIMIDAPRREQRISISCTAASPIDVFVVTESNREQLEKQLLRGQAVTAPVLAKSERQKDGSLEATIPGGTAFAVVLSNTGGKAVQVQARIKS